MKAGQVRQESVEARGWVAECEDEGVGQDSVKAEEDGHESVEAGQVGQQTTNLERLDSNQRRLERLGRYL